MIAIVALSFYSEGVTTEAEALQAASDHYAIHARPGLIFDYSQGPGANQVWDVDAPITLHADRGIVVPGKIVNTVPMVAVLRIEAHSATFLGPVVVHGAGGVDYDTRTATDLVWLGNVGDTQFRGFDLANASRDCLTTADWTAGSGEAANLSTIATQFGHVAADNCGSSAIDGHTSSFEFEWTSVVHTGTASSVNSKSELGIPSGELDGQPIDKGSLLYIEGRVHWVFALELGVPPADDTLTVQPQLWGTATSGTVISSHGAGVRLRGGNTSGHTGTANCKRAGTCVRIASLYGGVWTDIVAQSSGICLALGDEPGSAHLRGWYAMHCELPDDRRSGVKVSRTVFEGVSINSLLRTPVGTTRWEALSPHLNDVEGTYSRWKGVSFNHSEQPIPGADVQYTAPLP